MLDPLTAFSLACGTMQVVGFGCEIVSHAKELYERGSLESNDDIERSTKRLRSLNNQLLSDCTRDSLQNPRYQTLVDLATECSQTAMKLLGELDKLKITDPRSMLGTFIKKPIATIRKKGKLEKLKSKLECSQRILDSTILSMLRQDIQTLTLEQGNSFDQIDKSIRSLIRAFIEQSCSFTDLAQILNQRDENVQYYIEESFRRREIADLSIKHQQDFLATLSFPGIDKRQEQIQDTYKETFKWIFDESGARIRPWSNFTQWLQYSSDPYWISGKPGSGKSTLMNFIVQDERTKDCLNVWAGSKKLLYPCFFFWAAGDDLQKTIPGLLRSLTYQILKTSPDLLASLAITESRIVWTEKKLIEYMQKILQQATATYRICFFVDGLDELSGDNDKLVQLILDLSDEIGIKFCIASRPDKLFETLGSTSMLRLQDLTRSDIQEFVQAKLGELSQIKRLPPKDRHRKEEIFNEVVERANGVFLWVHLAVQTQINGISADDTFEMLQQRLFSLPEQVQDLYSDMLRRIDGPHRKEVAKYIRVVLTLDSTSIFDCAVATYFLANGVDLDSSRMESRAVAEKCQYVHNRILTICAGFLQVEDRQDPSGKVIRREWLAWEQDESVKDSLSTRWTEIYVSFLHRTALDYFKENGGDGEQFLIRNSSELPLGVLYVASPLARMRLCNLPDSAKYMTHMVYECMQSNDGGWTPHFTASFDNIVGELDKKHNPTAGKSHWCTRWGPPAASESQDHTNYWDKRLHKEIENQEYMPNDLVTLAARYRREDIVTAYLDQVEPTVDPRQLTRLVFCMIWRTWIVLDFWHSWGVEDWENFPILDRAIQLGVDASIGPGAIVWEMILGYIYSEIFRGLTSGGNFAFDRRHDLCNIFEAFLRSGAEVEPVIFIECSWWRGPINHVSGEVDTALAPLIEPLLEELGPSSELQRLDASRQRKAHGKAVRIWFGSDGAWKSKPSDGYLMTPEESHSFHQLLNQVIVHWIKDNEIERKRCDKELRTAIKSMQRKTERAVVQDEKATSSSQSGDSSQSEDEHFSESDA